MGDETSGALSGLQRRAQGEKPKSTNGNVLARGHREKIFPLTVTGRRAISPPPELDFVEPFCRPDSSEGGRGEGGIRRSAN